MRLFAEAASAASLSAAGRKLGLSQAAAGARLAKLEGTLLLAKLFGRTSRHCSSRTRDASISRVARRHCRSSMTRRPNCERAGCGPGKAQDLRIN